MGHDFSIAHSGQFYFQILSIQINADNRRFAIPIKLFCINRFLCIFPLKHTDHPLVTGFLGIAPVDLQCTVCIVQYGAKFCLVTCCCMSFYRKAFSSNCRCGEFRLISICDHCIYLQPIIFSIGQRRNIYLCFQFLVCYTATSFQLFLPVNHLPIHRHSINIICISDIFLCSHLCLNSNPLFFGRFHHKRLYLHFLIPRHDMDFQFAI